MRSRDRNTSNDNSGVFVSIIDPLFICQAIVCASTVIWREPMAGIQDMAYSVYAIGQKMRFFIGGSHRKYHQLLQLALT